MNDGPLNYTIRALTSDDQLIIWDLLYEALWVPADKQPWPREFVYGPELRRYAEDYGKPTDIGFAAVDPDGTIMGATWARLLQGEEKGYGYVDNETPELGISLFAPYRGQGIGTALLERLIEEAATRFPSISLSADAGNPAVRIYKKLGFEVVRQEGNGFVMKRRFNAARAASE